MSTPIEWNGPLGYLVSTERSRLDLDFIHSFLVGAYWSPGVPRDVVERSIANSLPFGLYTSQGRQAGFARAVTDYAQYAYLGDVFVDDSHRGRGLGKFLVGCVLGHPELQGLRRGLLPRRTRTSSTGLSDLNPPPDRPYTCSSSARPRRSGASGVRRPSFRPSGGSE